MNTLPNVVHVPREFFIGERDRYSQWPVAFWRELFQNSVDAGAKRVSVTIEPLPSGDTRVVVTDDGCGMSRETLETVFFRLGASSKSGSDQVGGFGIARLLTCFSQKHYAIATGTIRVEGEGAFFRVDDLAAAPQGDSTLAPPAPLAGCTFSIDVDCTTKDRWGQSMTMSRLCSDLGIFLGRSELACEIMVNGEARVATRKSGDPRRRLVGVNDLSFATVHVSDAPDSDKNYVFVHVGSIWMHQIYKKTNRKGSV
jgi:hypothetical protein